MFNMFKNIEHTELDSHLYRRVHGNSNFLVLSACSKDL